WFGIGGGDALYTAVDPSDYNIVITESQDGATNRYNLAAGGRGQSIRPTAGGGRGGRGGRGGGQQPAANAAAPGAAGAGAETPAAPPVQVGGQGFGRGGGAPNVLNAIPGDQYRFNWNTPVIMSPHNPKIVWLGGNRLFKSYNQGDTWVASEDLTKKIDRATIAVMEAPGTVTQ